MRSRRTALASLSEQLTPIIGKDVKDPMIADHLRLRVLRLVEEMLDDNGKAVFVLDSNDGE